MAKKKRILDPTEYDLENVIADTEEIRRYNRHRFEMEQLTAVVYDDFERKICVGYKDLAPDEFWVRGHFPGTPVMPGVIMCEAAAQLASYYTIKHQLMDTLTVGFGGLKNVHFRGMVKPGDRFVIVLQLLRVKRFMLSCAFQCIVDDNLVCEGVLKGVPLPPDLFPDAPT